MANLRMPDDSPPTQLQIEMAQADLLSKAHEISKQRGCSLIVAMGLIEADLKRKLAGIDAMARPNDRR